MSGRAITALHLHHNQPAVTVTQLSLSNDSVADNPKMLITPALALACHGYREYSLAVVLATTSSNISTATVVVSTTVVRVVRDGY